MPSRIWMLLPHTQQKCMHLSDRLIQLTDSSNWQTHPNIWHDPSSLASDMTLPFWLRRRLSTWVVLEMFWRVQVVALLLRSISHTCSRFSQRSRGMCKFFYFFALFFLVCILDFFGLMDMCREGFIDDVEDHVCIAQSICFFWALGQNRLKIPSPYQS